MHSVRDNRGAILKVRSVVAIASIASTRRSPTSLGLSGADAGAPGFDLIPRRVTRRRRRATHRSWTRAAVGTRCFCPPPDGQVLVNQCQRSMKPEKFT
jgi:hypothetical protein